MEGKCNEQWYYFQLETESATPLKNMFHIRDLIMQDLPEKDKALYEKKAKDYKKMMRGADGDCFRMDNQGKLLSVGVSLLSKIPQPLTYLY